MSHPPGHTMRRTVGFDARRTHYHDCATAPLALGLADGQHGYISMEIEALCTWSLSLYTAALDNMAALRYLTWNRWKAEMTLQQYLPESIKVKVKIISTGKSDRQHRKL